MTRALLITCHPRPASLTHAVAAAFAANAAPVAFERADLYAEGFDPSLHPADEPDWDDPRKVYSPAVLHEMARVERNAATVMVFPVWWWSVPAMLKGWMDRVLNNGWAYGDRTYPHADVWMLGVAGNTGAHYAAQGYDDAMQVQLTQGVLGYCGVARPRLEILTDAMGGDAATARLLDRAARLGADFAATLAR